MTPFVGLAAEPSAQLILHSLAHAVLLLDAQLNILTGNRAASALFGVANERLRGLPLSGLIPNPEVSALLREFGPRGTKVIETTLSPRRRRRGVVVLKITATRLAVTSAEMREIAGLPGPVIRREYRLLLVEDVSEKARLEQQLVDTEKQAAIGQLAAGILHEVNNPVASIGSNLLFVRHALGASAAPQVVEALDVTLEQLDQMRQLLGTLSGVPGRMPPRFETADLQDVIRRCVTFIAPEAERRRILVSVAFADAPLTCEMDVRLIKQVLLNLLKNAMEAMPDGGQLDVRLARGDSTAVEGPSVVVHIVDSGVGILEADLRKVFRPLYSTKPRGAGLGLSFCRQAVEEHGGEIRLKPRPGQAGTIATVTLPVRQPADECA